MLSDAFREVLDLGAIGHHRSLVAPPEGHTVIGRAGGIGADSTRLIREQLDGPGVRVEAEEGIGLPSLMNEGISSRRRNSYYLVSPTPHFSVIYVPPFL